MHQVCNAIMRIDFGREAVQQCARGRQTQNTSIIIIIIVNVNSTLKRTFTTTAHGDAEDAIKIIFSDWLEK